MNPPDPLHVAAAVLRDATGRVLLSRRPDHLHQGGLWEFPGGKVEAGETAVQGLARELWEELGIHVGRCRPFICVDHAYPELSVRLDVHEVLEWTGDPQPLEGQQLRWADPVTLDPATFPAADVPVLTALQLPPHYVISGVPSGRGDFFRRLDGCLERGERLLQLRAPGLADAELASVVRAAVGRCERVGARLMVNAAPELASHWGAHGIHLPARRLMGMERRPVGPDTLLAASCHDAGELAQAKLIGVDFVVLSPLRPTPSHPDRSVLGWARFEALVASAGMPVYALGGMRPDDFEAVRAVGGFGVAGIGAFWE